MVSPIAYVALGCLTSYIMPTCPVISCSISASILLLLTYVHCDFCVLFYFFFYELKKKKKWTAAYYWNFSTMKRHLNSYMAGFQWLEHGWLEHGNHVVGRKFDVGMKCVRQRHNKKDALRNTSWKRILFEASRASFSDRKKSSSAMWWKGWTTLKCWLRTCCVMKAWALARAINIPCEDFSWCAGWAWRFVKRKGLSFWRRTTLSQWLSFLEKTKTKKIVCRILHKWAASRKWALLSGKRVRPLQALMWY